MKPILTNDMPFTIGDLELITANGISYEELTKIFDVAVIETDSGIEITITDKFG